MAALGITREIVVFAVRGPGKACLDREAGADVRMRGGARPRVGEHHVDASPRRKELDHYLRKVEGRCCNSNKKCQRGDPCPVRQAVIVLAPRSLRTGSLKGGHNAQMCQNAVGWHLDLSRGLPCVCQVNDMNEQEHPEKPTSGSTVEYR